MVLPVREIAKRPCPFKEVACSTAAPVCPHCFTRFPPILTTLALLTSPCRYFDTNYHFEVPELSHDSGEFLAALLGS